MRLQVPRRLHGHLAQWRTTADGRVTLGFYGRCLPKEKLRTLFLLGWPTQTRAGTGMWFSYFFVPLAFLACLAAVLVMPFWASVFVCVLLLLFTFAAMTPTARLTDNS